MTQFLAKLVTLLSYPLVLVASRWGDRSDPLQLVSGEKETYWVKSTVANTPESYFSDGAEDGNFAARLLVRIAGLFAPRNRDMNTVADNRRDDSIPDEIYTLW
mgnify:CR=1 FL=1